MYTCTYAHAHGMNHSDALKQQYFYQMEKILTEGRDAALTGPLNERGKHCHPILLRADRLRRQTLVTGCGGKHS
jgi:hypothetical protein